MKHDPILLAASRGARIQFLFTHHMTEGYMDAWIDTTAINVDYLGHYRIHPDDEYMRFGVISSQFREYAADPDYGGFPDVILERGSFFTCLTDVLAFGESQDAMQRSLFLLFMSEALSEEGL